MSAAKAKKKEQKPIKSVIYLAGESPLLEEYAELCSRHGYEVIAELKMPAQKKPVGKSFKQSSTIPPQTVLALELTNTDLEAKKKNLLRLDKALPETSAIVSSSVTVTASEQASWIIKKQRLVGFGAFPTFADKALVEVAPTVHSPAAAVEVVRKFFHSLGKNIEVVQDRVGLVLPRILCQIVNEAVFTLQDDVATPSDLDTAMKLGLNYPSGPIEWADRIGFNHVYAVINALGRELQEERYRSAPLLKQMAESGEWWKRS